MPLCFPDIYNNNLFFFEPQPCSTNRCMCEWHHWADAARANENDRWTKYLQTGIWEMPNCCELEQFIDDKFWCRKGRTKKTDLEKDQHAEPTVEPAVQELHVEKKSLIGNEKKAKNKYNKKFLLNIIKVFIPYGIIYYYRKIKKRNSDE